MILEQQSNGNRFILFAKGHPIWTSFVIESGQLTPWALQVSVMVNDSGFCLAGSRDTRNKLRHR